MRPNRTYSNTFKNRLGCTNLLFLKVLLARVENRFVHPNRGPL